LIKNIINEKSFDLFMTSRNMNILENVLQRSVYGWLRLATKVANRSEPIVQQRGFSEGKSEAKNYTRCCT